MTEPISITDIPKDAGLQWLKDNTFKIGADCQELFEGFFLENEIPINEMPDYMCLPVQCEILKNYRFRYRVVEWNGVHYLCLFKMMEPLVAVNGKKNIHFIFTYRILPSVMGADVSEVRRKWAEAGVDEEILVSEESPYNFNFYNTKPDVPELFNHRWMQHHRIPKMEGLVEVRTSIDGRIEDGVRELVDAWYARHNEGGKRNDFRCISMPTSPYHYQRAYLFNDKVVGYVSGTRFAKQLFSMIRKNAAQLGMIDDKFVSHNLGHFMMYDTHRMLLEDPYADAMFVFGKSQSNPNLTKHKMDLFVHAVPYTRRKILLS